MLRSVAVLIGTAAAAAVMAAAANYEDWLEPGASLELPQYASYPNANGALGVLNSQGPISTAGHAFFEPFGTNGRACVSCHQPANAMSLSLDAIRQRWDLTGGEDPIFAAVDGSNCPNFPQGERSSHSLLLERGLFRIAMPWPPKDWAGQPVTPEFTLEVVRDPTGCNLDPHYGLHADSPSVSVFRRPRVAANMKFVFPQRIALVNSKTAEPMGRDPESGRLVQMNLLSDARHPTLRAQARGAASDHLQTTAVLTEAQLQQIVDFQNQVFVAQTYDNRGGTLVEPGGPPGLGPRALANARTGLLGDYLDAPVFQPFDAWRDLAGTAQAEFRASVERGSQVFLTKLFWIRDAYGINHIGLGNPLKRSCTSCHNSQMTGMDGAPGWMDTGIANQPDNSPQLPLFKVTCRADAPPHPFLGRVILTNDPGRALVTGRCRDVGAIVMQQFRGLSARAPYFSNGQAADLRAIVEFYEERFDIDYTEQERVDLVNFLSVL